MESLQSTIDKVSLDPTIPERMVDIVRTICEQNNLKWNQLTHTVQFLPFMIKYAHRVSDLCFLNTVVPYGGLTEYQKSAIHQKIDQQYFPRSVYITDEQREVLSDAFVEELWFEYPLYFKLETGERGQWVTFCPTPQALRKTIEQHNCAFSLQEKCIYENEYCVQFYRIGEKFKISSITRRDIPEVTGDWIQSIHELISSQLSHDTTKTERIIRNIIATLQNENPDLLEEVLPSWVKKKVVAKASIDNGTVYKKIWSHLPTQLQSTTTSAEITQLEDSINTILHPLLEGLDYWRLDVTATDQQGLLAGDIQLIEVNAWWAIPTHVYDPELHLEQIMNELNDHFTRVADKALMVKNASTPEHRQAILDNKSEFYKAAKLSFNKKWIDDKNLLLTVGSLMRIFVKNEFKRAFTLLVTTVQFRR